MAGSLISTIYAAIRNGALYVPVMEYYGMFIMMCHKLDNLRLSHSR